MTNSKTIREVVTRILGYYLLCDPDRGDNKPRLEFSRWHKYDTSLVIGPGTDNYLIVTTLGWNTHHTKLRKLIEVLCPIEDLISMLEYEGIQSVIIDLDTPNEHDIMRAEESLRTFLSDKLTASELNSFFHKKIP